MPFQPHFEVRLTGRLGAGAEPREIFSCGFQVGTPTLPGAATIAEPAMLSSTVAAEIRDFMEAIWASPGLNVATNATLRAVKISAIGEDGKVRVNPATGQYLRFENPLLEAQPGGGGTAIYPFQVAQCITLRSLLPGGRGRGRMYLPSPTSPVDSSGLITVVEQQAVLDAVTGLVSVTNGVLQGAARSERVVVASSTGVNAEVVSCAVGRVLDTQRRRRSDQDEQYLIDPV